MTYEEYKQRKDALLKDIDQNHWQLMLGMAQNAIALIRRRTVEQGENPDGQKFQDIKPYTEQYLKFKKKKGRYRNMVDFTLMSRLWPNTQVALQENFISKENISKYKAVIEPLSDHNKMLMEVHTDARGQILALSHEETELIKRAYEKDIMNMFKKHGLA